MLKRELPAIRTAELPATYQRAKAALSACEQLDECQDWADRAKAMASYARQSEDKALEQMAVRIRSRAIKRCGELYRQIEPNPGGQPTHSTRATDGPSRISRRAAARQAAGMSERQMKTALRVANVPDEDFEALVESDAPPSVSVLARKGTRAAPQPLVDLQGRDPREFNIAVQAEGNLRQATRQLCALDPRVIVRGALPRNVISMRAEVITLLAWLNKLLTELDKEDQHDRTKRTAR